MTLPEARAVLADRLAHDDETIRTAARLLLERGTPDDIQTARRFVTFGLRHDPEKNHATR